jgi:hypothetical protein
LIVTTFSSFAVGAQIESGMMQLILEHTAFAMTTQSHDNHVTLWAAKVFANASDNGKCIHVNL